MEQNTRVPALDTVYQPGPIEQKWYERWREAGYFSCDINKDAEPFCIVMPPPNVTGQLHMGHALDCAVQDILTRWRRMQGRRAFWLPGTDHAGIATQAKVEEALAEEGLSKYDIGREKFVERAWEWKRRYHARITKQLTMMGCSCDWSKERFTLDEGCSEAVKETFLELYGKGLIYRGSYIVNWCSHCQTTISDIEVEHHDIDSHLWHLRYPFTDGSGYVTVATTRPETLLGDTAVAVNPNDARYQDKIGKTVILPVMQREIPLIADDYCDMEFGTGAVKVTPAHDPNDFEIALRHNLPQISVIGRDGRMTAEAGKYAGMKALDCREQLVEEFRALGLLESISELQHAVGHCYRCDSVVEPLVSPQWFVKMKPLAEPAITAVNEGRTRFVPQRFTRIYINWMENIRDWCISRQLWWGHRIPVWYCDSCGEMIAAKETPASCPKCNGAALTQDPDVLDTWFSSALWPFSTLGWPQKTQLLADFYPTSVLVTAYDIIFFWVARMIFSGLEQMGREPFRDVFIHGIVRDGEGRKMSKSLGNGIDPIEVIEQYGADTLRFMLINGTSPGNDLRFQPERLQAARNFANKLWNASRFTLMNLHDYQEGAFEPLLTLADKWILERLRQTATAVNASMEKYELGEAARLAYDFAWDEFCDWYVELAKQRLYKGNPQERHTAQTVLVRVLTNIMAMLHPFIPFITEELWQHLPHQGESLMLARFPDGEGLTAYPAEERRMSLMMDIIRAVRNMRAEANVPLGKKANITLIAEAAQLSEVAENEAYLRQLAQAADMEFLPAASPPPRQAAKAHVRGVDIYLPLAGLIDIEKETARLQKEIAVCDNELMRLAGKLNNASFVAKAPPDVVEKERAKQAEYEEKKRSLEGHLAMLEC
ncbi:MAG: valine--tRNA ligase [Clostridiales bacterium]|nr:valine--tRNA ligase [Clostridiales bacterium]